MASINTLIILDRMREKFGYAYQHRIKFYYDGGYHWMKLLSLRTLFILPVFEFFATEFVITDKEILMNKWVEHEYFWFDSQLYYRFSQGISGSLFNYGTFTLSRGGGGFGAKPTEYVYKKVKNAKLFKATLDSFNVKKIG